MRFLVDSCVSARVCAFLRDEAVIDKALETKRVLITGDKDFGEWIFLRGKRQPPLVRLSALAPAHQVQVVDAVIKAHSQDLHDGALITATQERLRVRRKRGDSRF